MMGVVELVVDNEVMIGPLKLVALKRVLVKLIIVIP
jgi:hypothetical protein